MKTSSSSVKLKTGLQLYNIGGNWVARLGKMIKILVTNGCILNTHTQIRGLLEKVWLEYESSGINWNVSGV